MVKKPGRKWSAAATRQSDTLDLEEEVFKSTDPVEITRSLILLSRKMLDQAVDCGWPDANTVW